MAAIHPEPAPMGDQLPSLQELQTPEQMELLDKVDQLRALGLSEITALPQLIVCGDQSSGKSSVLEAISGVPFPRKDNLCTRFATELILRRAQFESMSVSITPGNDRNAQDRQRIAQFQHHLRSKDDFPLLFEEAKDAMGLGDGGKSFSRDILRVEIYGPLQPQLTLVDLPGFIHTAQTESDISLVNDLITSYLENPRSIILAVVSAKSDIGTQVILTKARQADPDRRRTLGIITKPDLLGNNSDSERAYISLARNNDIVLHLGWHVVRNVDLAHEQGQEQTRDQLEASFFRGSNFNTLSSTITGIASLKSRLSRILFDQIRVELPRVLEEIESRIKNVQATRDQLGDARTDLAEQTDFLIKISEKFVLICENAAKGNYDGGFFLDGTEPERRLCANLRNKHFKFAETMRGRGARYKVVDKDAQSIEEIDGQYGSDDDDNYTDHEAGTITRNEAIKSACEKLKLNRGRELPGLPNPLLVGQLFREYSQPWEGLAREHIKDVWDAINKFLELVLDSLVGPDVADKIFQFWLQPIMEQKLATANEKLDELLEVHKDEPMTTNHYFISTRKELQQSKVKNDMKEILEGRLARPGQKIVSEDIPHIISMIPSETSNDMDMVAAEDAFDNMNAFYKVAMNLFIDNVPTLAIQGPMVRQVPKMFRPWDVNRMSADLKGRIAAESEDIVRLREENDIKLAKFEDGARICKQNFPRVRHNQTSRESNFRNSETSRQPQGVRNASGLSEPRQDLPIPSRPHSQTHEPSTANSAIPDPLRSGFSESFSSPSNVDHNRTSLEVPLEAGLAQPPSRSRVASSGPRGVAASNNSKPSEASSTDPDTRTLFHWPGGHGDLSSSSSGPFIQPIFSHGASSEFSNPSSFGSSSGSTPLGGFSSKPPSELLNSTTSGLHPIFKSTSPTPSFGSDAPESSTRTAPLPFTASARSSTNSGAGEPVSVLSPTSSSTLASTRETGSRSSAASSNPMIYMQRTPFQPHILPEGGFSPSSAYAAHQAVGFTEPTLRYSFEELHLMDYQRRHPTPSTQGGQVVAANENVRVTR